MGRCRSFVACCVAATAVAALPSTASATYSIVVTDSGNRWVGGGGTSCVGSLDVAVILGTAPGIGAIHAQAQLSALGRDEGVRLLMMNEAPDAIIAAIANGSFDPNFQARQYGVVDLMARAAGFTGTTNGVYAQDRQGTDAEFTYSVQGNILTSALVLDQAETAFVMGGGCDMPDRIMLALEGGAQNGEGDSRCTGQGIPSDSAFMKIVDDSGGEIIDITVTNTRPESPLIGLRSMYEAWRLGNPCPSGGTDTGGTGTDDGGSAGTSGADDATAGDDADSSSGNGTDGDTGGITAGDDSAGDGTATDSSSASASGGDGDSSDKGCSCTTNEAAPPAMSLLLLALIRRRR